MRTPALMSPLLTVVVLACGARSDISSDEGRADASADAVTCRTIAPVRCGR